MATRNRKTLRASSDQQAGPRVWSPFGGLVSERRMRLGEHATGLALKLKADGYARLVTELATQPARAIFSAFLPWPMLAA